MGRSVYTFDSSLPLSYSGFHFLCALFLFVVDERAWFFSVKKKKETYGEDGE